MANIIDKLYKIFTATSKNKANHLADVWNENPKRLQEKDLDTLCVKKDDNNHYGYKNSICIDAAHGFIRLFVVTNANIHDD